MSPSRRRHDVHSRFARAHLRTRDERAVYFTLVAESASSWSAEEMARLKDLDTGKTAAVLDRYAAVGIVDALDVPSGRRYRWRSDMTYLLGAEPGARPIDPVCGMTVHDETPYRARDTIGRTRLFCSAVCLARFQGQQDRTALDETAVEGSARSPQRGGSRHGSKRPPTPSTDTHPSHGPQRHAPVLTLLYVDDCPGFFVAAERLRVALGLSGADRLLVRAQPGRHGESGVAAGFTGSPTLLVNGVDPFPPAVPTTVLGCRFYRTETGLDAAPSVQQLVTVLRAHLTEPPARESLT